MLRQSLLGRRCLFFKNPGSCIHGRDQGTEPPTLQASDMMDIEDNVLRGLGPLLAARAAIVLLHRPIAWIRDPGQR